MRRDWSNEHSGDDEHPDEESPDDERFDDDSNEEGYAIGEDSKNGDINLVDGPSPRGEDTGDAGDANWWGLRNGESEDPRLLTSEEGNGLCEC